MNGSCSGQSPEAVNFVNIVQSFLCVMHYHANMLKEVCWDVRTEPKLQLLTEKRFEGTTALNADETLMLVPDIFGQLVKQQL